MNRIADFQKWKSAQGQGLGTDCRNLRVTGLADKQQRPKRHVSLLDPAIEALVKLIADRGAETASGDFGIVLTLDRGEHRRIRGYEMRTIEPAAQ